MIGVDSKSGSILFTEILRFWSPAPDKAVGTQEKKLSTAEAIEGVEGDRNIRKVDDFMTESCHFSLKYSSDYRYSKSGCRKKQVN